MSRRSCLFIAAAVTVLTAGLPSAFASSALARPQSTYRAGQSTPGYLSLLIAHTAETYVDGSCRPLSGVVPLARQAAEYRALGITNVTGTVVTDWPAQSYERCLAAPIRPAHP